VLWQPGPHPSAALAEPIPETIAKTATIKTIFISLFSLDILRSQRLAKAGCSAPCPNRILSELCDVLKTVFHGS
jgi:hypothetical protein